MNPILSPLVAVQSGDIGPAVGNLHAILARFDLAAGIPAEETVPSRFGHGTARMVIRLFALASLRNNPDGAISEDAAAQINQFLVSRGVLALVQGRASDDAGHPATGYRIQIHDRLNLDGTAAAEVDVSARGDWLAFYDPRFYLEARPGVIERTDEFVPVARAFNRDGTEVARSEPTPNPEGRARIDLVIRSEIRPEPVEGRRRVRGWLEDRNGAKLVGFAVEVYDRDIGPLRPEQWRGRATTLESGAFAIDYDMEDVAAGDSVPVVADLVFRVTNSNGQLEPRLQVARLPVDNDRSITVELPVPEDELPLGIPARQDEYVRLVATSARAPAGLSEFDILMAALGPLLDGRSPAEMDEAVNRDISFAARETGLDAGRIGDLVAAHRLAKGVLEGAPPTALYALARTLELRDALAIAQRSVKDLAEALKFAVPSLIAEPGVAVNALAADIHRRAAQVAIRMPVAGGASGSLADALALHLHDAGDQATLLQDFASFEGSTPDFWRMWAVSHSDKPVEAIQFSLQLAAVTSNHAPLVAAIQAAHPEIRSLRALTLELDALKVAALLGAAPPVLQPGESPEDGTKRFASSVSGMLDAAHPTAAVARLATSWAVDAPSAVSSGAAAMLRRLVLGTDYELGSGGLDKLAEAQADVLFEGVDDTQVRASTLADVGRIERLYNISSSANALSAMVTTLGPGGKPFKGAFDIGALGKDAFLAAFSGQPPEVMAELSSVHESAQLFAEAGASLVLAALHEIADPSMAATKPLSGAKPIPTWAQLFGSERLTQCDECRSLGGPASYLVRILEFLDKRCPPNAAGATPLDVLIGNPAKGIAGIRPDIAHIKLSCENTDTTMPEIDVGNEVMECHMVFERSLATPPNDSSPGATADELAAAPEHVQAQAYEMLAKAYFPISLPFDRSEAEARAYLDQAESSREEVMRLFNPVDADGLARERLRLTALDQAIICGPAAPERPSPTLFGLLPPEGSDPEVGWAARMNASLPTAAAILGLTVTELLALCSTRFISGAWSQVDHAIMARMPLSVASFTALRASGFATVPADIQEALDWVGITMAELKSVSDRNSALLAHTIVVDLPNHTRLDEMHLVHLDGTALSEADWLSLHRIARLARRSGIAIADLDLGLVALGADALDAKTLQGLGTLKALGESLKLDWIELAALVGEPAAALWHRLFVASRVAKSDPVFLPDANGMINPSPTVAIASHAVALAAAFNLQVPEVIDLAAALGLTVVDNASIARLWRMTRLASALGVATGEMIQMGALIGQLPLNGAAAMLEFAEHVKALKPVLNDALRFAGAQASPQDAAALQQAKDALAKATEGVDAGPSTRRARLESLAQSFSLLADVLALVVREQDAPDPGHVQRLSLLIGAFSLTLPDIVVLMAAKALPATDADAQALFASFRRVQAYVSVARNRDPAALALALATLASPVDAGWRDRVADAISACRPPHQGETSAAGAAAAKSLADDVKSILDLTLSWPAAPTPLEDPIRALAWIDARLAIATSMRTPAKSLANLVGGGAGAVSALDDLKRGVQARYEPATWLQVSRRINDPLRQARRDALVAFIKQKKGLDSDEAVFSELLLDPGVNSVVLISRIPNAMRTVWRFVHTVRLGMRSNNARPPAERVDAAQINPEWDLYLHSFRLTQANIEVLANPHFYMAPDLRDDKTPIFKEVEGFLRQNDATPDNVEHAFLTYLERLSEVSNLEICGTHLQEDFSHDEAFRFKSVLHVFGRSRGSSKRSYYYRRLNRYEHAQEWTPWEPVKVEINAVERDRTSTRNKKGEDTGKPEAGVHLLPVVWRGKLHIFWPMFIRKVETSDEKPAINMKDGTSNAETPRPYWEVKLCWSCLENGSWTPRQMSSDYHETFVLGV